MTRCRPGERGQATVELALVLPVLAFLLLALAQLLVVVVGEVRTVHAAREGARAGAVAEPIEAAVASRGGLPMARTAVSVGVGEGTVTVTVVFDQPTEVPLVGALVGDVRHTAAVTMFRED